MNRATVTSILLDAGGPLWSSVECDRKQERWIIRARLNPRVERSACDALRESERVLNDVLPSYLGDSDWIATVYWANRVSYTIARNRS